MHETGNGTKALLEELAWARRLATRMVADAGLAEDMVQDAWVQFLNRPPLPTGSLKGWFAKVMRNFARQEWRDDHRRKDLVQAQREERTGEATADLVARAQAQQALVQIVLRLEEPYRDVLLLRFFEELNSPAIAVRLGMPASSVRTRLKRGLELVRLELEKHHGADARHWLPALVPLLPPPVLRAPAAAAARAIATPSRHVGWAVSAALGAAVIVAAVLLSRPLFTPPEGPASDRSTAAIPGPMPERTERSTPFREPNSAARREEVSDKRDTAATDIGAGNVPTTTPALALATRVEVRIDGDLASAGVVLLSDGSRWIDRDDRWSDFDPGSSQTGVLANSVSPVGLAVFEGVAPMGGTVALEPSPGAATLQRHFRRNGESDSILLELGTARIEGRVWTAGGEPAEDVPVLLGVKVGYDYGALRGRCLSDSEGHFVFDGLPACSYWLHAESPGRVGELRSNGELLRGETQEILLGRPTGRVLWSGRLVDAAGDPIVFDSQAKHTLEFTSLDRDQRRACFPAELNPDGSYTVELVPGDYAVRRKSGDGSSTQLVEERVSVREEEQRDLVLRGTRIRGTAHVAGRGTPFDPDVDNHFVLRLVREEQGAPSTRYSTLIGAGGSYSFDGVAPGRWVLEGHGLVESQPVVVLVSQDDRERTVDLLVR